MKRPLLLLMFIILMNSTHVFSQPIAPQSITMNVALRQDTVLLGQPFFIYLVFTNHSNESVTLQKKGPFLKSKDEFLVISPDNDTTQMPEIDLVKGICPCNVKGASIIQPGQSRSFPIIVDKNANIKKTGTYTAAFSFTLDFIMENHVGTYQVSAHRQGKTTFTVMEDDSMLVAFIDHIAGTTLNNIFIPSGICCEPQQQEREYRMLLEAIDDKRIVPHLARAINNPLEYPINQTIELLSKFPFDSLAFSVLKNKAQGPDDSHCNMDSEDSIQINKQQTGVRLTAIKGIMARNDQQAIDFICALNNQDIPCERYGIVTNASQYFSAENAQKLYTFYLNDRHPAVRKKARELFKKSSFGDNNNRWMLYLSITLLAAIFITATTSIKKSPHL